MTPLVLVVHGSRDPAADECVRQVRASVRRALPGVEVRVGNVDVFRSAEDPPAGSETGTVAAAVGGLDGAVVVPVFLASGYHVRVDLPAQLAACGAIPERFPVTAALGPDPLLVRAVCDRLVEAGACAGDAVVLAAAGSSDPAALAEVRAAAALLSVAARTPHLRQHVRVGYAAVEPRVDAVVAGLRRAGARRVAVATWLLAPGFYGRRIAACGADTVAAPLGAHPGVVAAVLHRYRAAVAGRLAA